MAEVLYVVARSMTAEHAQPRRYWLTLSPDRRVAVDDTDQPTETATQHTIEVTRGMWDANQIGDVYRPGAR